MMNVNDLAQMDLSVLSCLGPDFDHQTVFHLLSSHGHMESVLSSPCLKSNDIDYQSFSYISKKRGSMAQLVPNEVSGASKVQMKFSTSLPSFSSSQPNRLVTSSLKRPGGLPNIAAHPYETPPPSTSTASTTTTITATTTTTTHADPAERAMEIALLLKEHPDSSCVLVTLIQEYQSRFQKPLHVSELYTMKHVIDIQDYGGKRVARLLPTFRSQFDELHRHTQLEQPFCLRHCPKTFMINPDLDLPFVHIPFRIFSENVRQLLTEHNGSMPLASFPQCYAHRFEPLIDHPQGVPLEHYISCIKDLQIVAGQGVIKKVQLSHSTTGTCLPNSSSSFDVSNMHVDVCAEVQQRLQQFSRDVLDLLKSQGFHCRLPVSKFVSSYHQYFNRQCRVADYGFSKVIDLLMAIPKSVQVLGDGNKRILTITHRCQIKRFANEMIRILKNKRQRSMPIEDIPKEYEMMYKKSFNVADYGMCFLQDLVFEIKDHKELVVDLDNDLIKLYRKERTELEIYATYNFQKDVIDMLRVLPNFSIAFEKFIPSYHHHFGYQCKVQAYGFCRLIDLLEELSTIVKIIEDKNGEKIVQLTTEMIEKAICLNIEQLIRNASKPLRLKDIPMHYAQVYRHALRPEDLGVANIEELILNMNDKFHFHYVNNDVVLSIKESSSTGIQLIRNVIRILMLFQCQLPFERLKQEVFHRYQQEITLEMCREKWRDFLDIIDENVRLTPAMVFAYHIVLLLNTSNGWMNYDQFLLEYQRRTNSNHLLYPSHYGFPTMTRLFDAIRFIVQVQGQMLVIHPEFRSAEYSHSTPLA